MPEQDSKTDAAAVGPFFRAVTPNDRWAVEVWETARPPESSDTEAWYRGTVTLDGRMVVESITTPDTDKLLNWARRQMVEAMRRS